MSSSYYDKGKSRFTITDYVYDRGERAMPDQEDHNFAESSQQASTSVAGARAMASMASSSSSGVHYPPMPRHPGTQGKLRLHEPSPSPTHNDVYLPSTFNSLFPHPSLPRSFSPQTTEEDIERRAPSPELFSPRTPMSPTVDGDGDDDGDARSVMTDMSEKQAQQRREEKEKAASVEAWPTPRPVVRVRWWDRIIPSTTLTRILLATIILELIIDLAVEGNILYRFNEEVKSTSSTDLEVENKRRLPIYLIIFGLAHLWQLVLTVIAIRTKNTVQVIAVTLFNYAFLGYAIIQIYELRKILGDNLAAGLTSESGTGTTLMTIPLNVLTALIIGVVAASCLVLSVLCVLLRREFGWQRYRFLGADLMIREYYFKLQVFECICYFSAFFCAGFGVQFIWLVLNPTDVEYIITWIAFPLLIIFLVIGRFAAKYENRYFMAAFMVGLCAGCAYFIFKLVRIWQQADTTYNHLEKSLTTFDVLSLVLLAACGVWGVMVWMNFGKGLKQAVLENSAPVTVLGVLNFWRTDSTVSVEKGQEMSMAQRRVSID
ncbi:hypothetical protein IAT38_007743 [Cryptococcus sp. DSM 104549]